MLERVPTSQVVDGVLTDDNDAFLYGAKTVYCELSANEKVHCMALYEDLITLLYTSILRGPDI